jgi:hypothetical protein
VLWRLRWTVKKENEIFSISVNTPTPSVLNFKEICTITIGLLIHLTEGKIEGLSEGKTRKKMYADADDLRETTGYWKLKEETLDRNLWRTRFGRGNGPVVGQTA